MAWNGAGGPAGPGESAPGGCPAAGGEPVEILPGFEEGLPEFSFGRFQKKGAHRSVHLGSVLFAGSHVHPGRSARCFATRRRIRFDVVSYCLLSMPSSRWISDEE